MTTTTTTTESADRLAPCPFCGSDNVGLETNRPSGFIFAVCRDCGAEGPCEDHSNSAEDYWNRRAATEAAEPVGAVPDTPGAKELIEWINAGAFGMESAHNRWVMCEHVRRIAALAARVPGKPEGVVEAVRDWPEDFAQENGRYENKCSACKRNFMGNKHRRMCKVCSDPAPVGDVVLPVYQIQQTDEWGTVSDWVTYPTIEAFEARKREPDGYGFRTEFRVLNKPSHIDAQRNPQPAPQAVAGGLTPLPPLPWRKPEFNFDFITWAGQSADMGVEFSNYARAAIAAIGPKPDNEKSFDTLVGIVSRETPTNDEEFTNIVQDGNKMHFCHGGNAYRIEFDGHATHQPVGSKMSLLTRLENENNQLLEIVRKRTEDRQRLRGDAEVMLGALRRLAEYPATREDELGAAEMRRIAREAISKLEERRANAR